ncbi:hypothetical protein Tco_1508313 [Tanacetum coccineum]
MSRMDDDFFTYEVGNALRYQDLEWYEALDDGKLKDEALKTKAIMEGMIDDDDESHNKVIMEYLVKISKKARILELKMKKYEDYCSDIIYAVSIKEDTAYLFLKIGLTALLSSDYLLVYVIVSKVGCDEFKWNLRSCTCWRGNLLVAFGYASFAYLMAAYHDDIIEFVTVNKLTLSAAWLGNLLGVCDNRFGNENVVHIQVVCYVDNMKQSFSIGSPLFGLAASLGVVIHVLPLSYAAVIDRDLKLLSEPNGRHSHDRFAHEPLDCAKRFHCRASPASVFEANNIRFAYEKCIRFVVGFLLGARNDVESVLGVLVLSRVF